MTRLKAVLIGMQEQDLHDRLERERLPFTRRDVAALCLKINMQQISGRFCGTEPPSRNFSTTQASPSNHLRRSRSYLVANSDRIRDPDLPRIRFLDVAVFDKQTRIRWMERKCRNEAMPCLFLRENSRGRFSTFNISRLIGNGALEVSSRLI